jgi:hypothetical protein
MSRRSFARVCASLTILCSFALNAGAQAAVREDHSDPCNVTILDGGEGVMRPLTTDTTSLEANGSWFKIENVEVKLPRR